jgi:hypothetical protein
MGRRGLALVLGLLLAGCTHEVETPQPRRERPVAPIAALQAGDLLSPGTQDKDGNLFITVEPEDCSGIAREVDPPFIFGHAPVATDGGHTVVAGNPEVYIEEMIGVYHADFDAPGALVDAQRSIEACGNRQFTVTSMRGRKYLFHLLPQRNPDSPNIVLWSFKGDDWACDNAFVAAHNAAIGIATCASVGGYDVLSLARGALTRIEKLANTTA